MHLINQENQKYLEKYKKEVKKFFDGELRGENLKEYQTIKLREILQYVYENSLYYHNKLNCVIDKVNELTIDDINKIPFTTKEDLREADIDILSQPISKNAYYYETTGTTGNATPCPRSIIDVMSSNITISLALNTVFVSVFGNEKPVVGVFGPTEVHSFGDTLGNVCHNLDMCVVKAWPYSPVIGFEKALELMKKLKIGAIMCTPGLAMTLFKAAKMNNYDIKNDFSVKMFMLTGEMCTPEMADNIADLWGAKVFNFLYGSQEALVMATCNEENRMNTFPNNYIYEVIDINTGKSKFEGEGELVVTMLNPGGKPLIRYRTGDMVKIEDVVNSPLPSKEITIMGRIKDRIPLNNQFLKASQIDSAIMKKIRKCIGYQLIIDNLTGKDTVEIKLEMLDKKYESDDILNGIKIRFMEEFNTEAKVYFTNELSAVIYTGAMVSWKAARIIDKRNSDQYAVSEQKAAEQVLKSGAVKYV